MLGVARWGGAGVHRRMSPSLDTSLKLDHEASHLAVLLTAAALPLLIAIAHKFVYVLTLGYGCAFVAIGGVLLAGHAWLWLAGAGAGAPAVVHAALLVAYGARYAGLMAWRERFFPEFTGQHAETERFGPLRRLRSVLLVAVICTLEASPALFHAEAGPCGCAWLVHGALASAVLALCVESLADWQKAAFKQRLKASGPRVRTRASGGRREEPFTEGLFRTWRHPNYTMDILFWASVFVAGLPALVPGACGGCDGLPPAQRAVAVRVIPLLLSLAGQAVQVCIMCSVCARREESQLQRYGARNDFQEYLRRSGALFPRLALWQRVARARDRED